MLNKNDILQHIIDSIYDPEELIDRLGLDVEQLVYKLETEIMSSLDAFEDIYSSDGEE